MAKRNPSTRDAFNRAHRAQRAWTTRRITMSEYDAATRPLSAATSAAESAHRQWRTDVPARLSWKQYENGTWTAYLGGGTSVDVTPAPRFMTAQGYVAVIDPLGIGGAPRYIERAGSTNYGTAGCDSNRVFATVAEAKRAASRYLLLSRRRIAGRSAGEHLAAIERKRNPKRSPKRNPLEVDFIRRLPALVIVGAKGHLFHDAVVKAYADSFEYELPRLRIVVSGAEGHTPMQVASAIHRKVLADSRSGARRANPTTPAATVGTFLTVLKSKLVQQDEKENRKHFNLYRLGHYLRAAENVQAKVKNRLDKSDTASFERLKMAIAEHFTLPFAPASATIRQIDAYMATGKRPSLTK